jgi:hypothetical protein
MQRRTLIADGLPEEVQHTLAHRVSLAAVAAAASFSNPIILPAGVGRTLCLPRSSLLRCALINFRRLVLSEERWIFLCLRLLLETVLLNFILLRKQTELLHSPAKIATQTKIRVKVLCTRSTVVAAAFHGKRRHRVQPDAATSFRVCVQNTRQRLNYAVVRPRKSSLAATPADLHNWSWHRLV